MRKGQHHTKAARAKLSQAGGWLKGARTQFRARMLGVTLERIFVRVPRNLYLAARIKAELEGADLQAIILELLIAYAGDEAEAEIDRIATQHKQALLKQANDHLTALQRAAAEGQPAPVEPIPAVMYIPCPHCSRPAPLPYGFCSLTCKDRHAETPDAP